MRDERRISERQAVATSLIPGVEVCFMNILTNRFWKEGLARQKSHVEKAAAC